MWTEALAPSARSPKAQSRTPAVMAHFGLSGDSCHWTPFGSGSWSVTLLAVPGPSLVTVIVYPASWPALIVASSATFVTETLGFLTIALGWMLRSWFLLPLPSRFCVRMCHGAPETAAAPFGAFAPVTQ